jgi:DNA modification methylase
MHLCALQLDIADRAIIQYTMKGETVFDPFAGIGTVPLRALKLGRKGQGCELSHAYYTDALWYLRTAEMQGRTPSLFDVLSDEMDENVTLVKEAK